jgi:hypothetical protein
MFFPGHGHMSLMTNEPNGKDEPMNATNDLDLGHDLQIIRTERRPVGGTWVSGTIHGHRFDALIFPEHAADPDYEIEDSRISKLWVRREADQQVVFNFDRGLDVPAVDATTKAIVEFLCAGLAESTYGA